MIVNMRLSSFRIYIKTKFHAAYFFSIEFSLEYNRFGFMRFLRNQNSLVVMVLKMHMFFFTKQFISASY